MNRNLLLSGINLNQIKKEFIWNPNQAESHITNWVKRDLISILWLKMMFKLRKMIIRVKSLRTLIKHPFRVKPIKLSKQFLRVKKRDPLDLNLSPHIKVLFKEKVIKARWESLIRKKIQVWVRSSKMEKAINKRNYSHWAIIKMKWIPLLKRNKLMRSL